MEEQEEAGNDEIGWQDDVQVMSDVHVGYLPEATSCTTIFTFVQPFHASAGSDSSATKSWDPETCLDRQELENGDGVDDVKYDDGGDLILQRRRKRFRHSQSGLSGERITVHHQLTTHLHGVGLQVWRGALLLADFLLDTMSSSVQFHSINAIELGAGTGLAGIVMARAAKRVFVTDRGAHILDNCTRNVLANGSLYAHGDGAVQVRELDWFLPSWPPVASCDAEDGDEQETARDAGAYVWSEEDLDEARSATVLLAADVVYSPELTLAFFEMLEKIMAFGANKTLFLTLEKRYNFSVNELDVVANGYKQFRSYFHTTESGADDCNIVQTRDISAVKDFEGKFEGRLIPTEEVQQRIIQYDRGKDLELWEITRCKCQVKRPEIQ